MRYDEVRERLKAVVVTNVTPFREDGTVDEEAAARQAAYMVDHGIQVVVPCGNTGEFTSLSIDEAKQMVTAVTRAVGDRALVIAGVGWSSPIAGELARHAQEVGAHGLMVHHPTHTYIHRDGLRRYYEAIASSVDLPVVLYKRGAELTDALIAELVDRDQFVAVKYASNDPNAFTNLVDGSESDVAWLCGTAERWAPYFALGGAQGFTSGLANFAPEKALAMFDALESGDYSGAMKVRRQVAGFEELRQQNFSGNNVPVVKEAMRLLGMDTGVVRDPLTDLTDEERDVVHGTLADWGLLDA